MLLPSILFPSLSLSFSILVLLSLGNVEVKQVSLVHLMRQIAQLGLDFSLSPFASGPNKCHNLLWDVLYYVSVPYLLNMYSLILYPQYK